MKLMDMKEMLAIAAKNGYAVGSFSPRNTYLIEYTLRAAEACSSPVIVQISTNEFGWFKVNAAEFGRRFHELSERFNVPAVLHLDHTKELSVIKEAIDGGFNSVMIDASQRDFEDNIAITKEVADYAHSKNVCVEAELGRIGATDKIETDGDDTALYTDPDEALEFVKRTGADTLAISIGTAHGVYPVKNPKIDFERLTRLRAILGVPLVLHGGSGLPADTVNRAVRRGISKVNIATDLEQAFLAALGRKDRLLNSEIWELEPAELAKAGEAVQAVVEEKIRSFVCSAGKAGDML